MVDAAQGSTLREQFVVSVYDASDLIELVDEALDDVAHFTKVDATISASVRAMASQKSLA
ncbi:hypothetical protein [Methylocystis sp.]|uniref:hypothetical protein n=1 Tax=Methylocystis sp. TaxID=1911079 RepID=UPI003D14F5F9